MFSKLYSRCWPNPELLLARVHRAAEAEMRAREAQCARKGAVFEARQSMKSVMKSIQ